MQGMCVGGIFPVIRFYHHFKNRCGLDQSRNISSSSGHDGLSTDPGSASGQ